MERYGYYMLGLMLTVMILPLVGGILLQFIKFENRKFKQLYIFGYVFINTLLVYILLSNGTTENINIPTKIVCYRRDEYPLIDKNQ